jgi:hypothetical protein
MDMQHQEPGKHWKLNTLLLHKRWTWHLLFWLGYALFRFWPYYITVNYYTTAFLEYMLLSELVLVGVTYFTLWLYKSLLRQRKYLVYFISGSSIWLLYLYGRTIFQFGYLQNERGFNASFIDVLINSTGVVLVYFLFLTACKYFKDGYIAQQFETAKKEQQLQAEVNNLKSQIAPHFLFNTLNNLYGLAVERSDKLPDLMLRLSDLLRHALYETQKPLVPLNAEIDVIKSYIDLESLRMEDDLRLTFENAVPPQAAYLVAPLVLIVFVENAFKHAKAVQPDPVNISIQLTIQEDVFSLIIRNNYREVLQHSGNGIGLVNVKRRLEVLYPDSQHQLSISKDGSFYTVSLRLQLLKAV